MVRSSTKRLDYPADTALALSRAVCGASARAWARIRERSTISAKYGATPVFSWVGHQRT